MATCITPMAIRNKISGNWQLFPCGKCPPCKARRVSSWSFRCMQQERVSTSAHFVTLTYNTSHVPISHNHFMTLDKSDVQKFLKRLRKRSTADIKYLCVGEYGGRGGRPHYHLIMFNVLVTDVMEAWSLTDDAGDRRSLGDCHFGSVTGASVGYTLKYMMKEPSVGKFVRDDRVKEFMTVSKGLGLSYLSDRMVAWHKADLVNRMYVNVDGNKKVSMPRYFKDKLYSELERDVISFESRKRNDVVLDEMEAKYVDDPYFFADKAEADIYSFSKMFHDAKFERNKA